MFITKNHLSRRTLLKGGGAMLALPLLDAMIPALTAQSRTAADTGLRLGFIYHPHGAIMDRYTPETVGRGFEFQEILKPLEPFRNQLTIVSGLGHAAADTSAVHSLSPTTWLSGVRPKPTQGVDAYAGVTADQIAAAQIGQDTMLPSMELATEDHSGLIGACDRDYGCIYMNTLSWRTPTTPMPMEINPRKVFERMFGQGGSPEERQARRAEDQSILDAVAGQAGDLKRRLGSGDNRRLDEYIDNVREIERRLQRAEADLDSQVLDLPEAPPGIPFVYEDHVDIMFDLLALACQANVTRVFTFMMAREISNRTYNQVGVPDGHHAISHHQNREERMAKNVLIQHYHVTLFSRFVDKLRTTPEAGGSLLDNTLLLYGSNMSNSNAHNHYPLPNIVISGSGRFAGGQHISYEERTPMTNLLVAMLNKAGVEIETLGDSTGTVSEL